MRTVSLLLALVTAIPLVAQPRRNEIALGFGLASFTEYPEELSPEEEIATVSYNRFWTPAASTRLGYMQYGVGFGEHVIAATTLIVEHHPLRTRSFSPYGGVGVAHARADVGGRSGGRAEGELAPLAKLGADLNLEPWFALGADATYMRYAPGLSNGRTFDLSPLTLTGALKLRF